MTIRIITNHHWRDFICGYDLPESARADFDYLSDEEYDCHDFIKYRGVYYDASEFMRAPDSMAPWQGIHTDTYFSGVVMRYSDDGEQYQVGLALS